MEIAASLHVDITPVVGHDVVVNPTIVSDSTGDDPGIPTRLMVMGMAKRNGDIITAELAPVMDACGLSPDQVRSCLRRLVNEGLFERDGEGRDSRYHATEAGLAELRSIGDRTVLAYAQDHAGRGWDRRWRIVAFAIPESMRASRDRFRDRLLALGAAAVHNGLYVAPHRWDTEVRAEISRLGIGAYVTMATTDDLEIGGTSNPRDLAGRLWPLEQIAERYRDFIATYESVPAELEAMMKRGERIAEHDFLPGALQIAIRFMRCFEADPLLPPELLPKPWPGRDAREVLVRCRKLGLLTREEKGGPAMFSVFDEAISALP